VTPPPVPRVVLQHGKAIWVAQPAGEVAPAKLGAIER